MSLGADWVKEEAIQTRDIAPLKPRRFARIAQILRD